MAHAPPTDPPQPERLRNADVHRAAADGASTRFGEWGYLIDGRWETGDDPIEVRSPFDGRVIAVAHHGGPDAVERAIASVTDGFSATRALPAYRRSEVLLAISEGLEARTEDFAQALSAEAGKPIDAARGEVSRAVFTFRVASEEARRIYGEVLPLDWLPGNEGKRAQVLRVPLGPIAGITPFNYPLNLVAHKVAPAMAAGDSIVLRPDSQTPLSSLMLGELALEAGWPRGGIAVVPTRVEHAAPFVEDERIRMLSFTGSPGVGWMLKSRAGKKRVALELGGNAGTIVHHDADLAHAAERIAWGGFQYAGQSCISVQRVFVHDTVWDDFVAELVPQIQALVVGDPADDATDVGPVIDAGAAERIVAWVDEAVDQGATLLTGGSAEGTLVQPTVLAEVDPSMRVACEEIFGPVISLLRYTDVDDAIAKVDDSEFGLQAGLFTNDHAVVQRAFERLEVGGLIVGDVSTYRIDHMPYGGAKASGFGREGLRYAIEEMTEMKILVDTYPTA